MEGIIVCGLGHVGYRIVGLLHRLGEPMSVISLDGPPAWERWADGEGIRLIKGDARDSALLEQAGLDRARAVIAATDNDAANVEIILDVRDRRPDIPVVLRLFDQTLAHQLERNFGIRAFGMSAVAAPSFAAAAMGEQVLGSFTAGPEPCRITRVVIEGPNAGMVATVGGFVARHGVAPIAYEPRDGEGTVAPRADQELEQGDHLIIAGSAAACEAVGTSPSASRNTSSRTNIWRRTSAKLGAVRWLWAVWRGGPRPLRTAFVALNLLILMSVAVFFFAMQLSAVDAFYFVVSTVTTTGYGDITPRDAPDALKLYAALVMILGSLTLAATYSLITDFVVTSRFRELMGGREVPTGGHTIVVGLGNVGYRVADTVGLADQVVVIERDLGTEFVEAARQRIALVPGDGRMNETLRRAHASSARSVVAVTGDDATNLAIGLAARQLSPDARLVIRIFDADFAEKVRHSMGFQAVLSGSAIAAPTFVGAALWPDAVAAIQFERWLLVIRRCVLEPSPGVADNQKGEETTVLAVRGADATPFSFGGSLEPEPGDEVIALTWRSLVS
jgi:Trk K+ transport system NAD-binding subunit